MKKNKIVSIVAAAALGLAAVSAMAEENVHTDGIGTSPVNATGIGTSPVNATGIGTSPGESNAQGIGTSPVENQRTACLIDIGSFRLCI